MSEETIVTLMDGSTVRYRGVTGFTAYRVGSDGSLWSCWVRGRYKHPGTVWRRLGGSLAHGHPFTRLHGTDGSYRAAYIHCLILEAFVGPCPSGMECRHLNGLPRDNRLENLIWGTPRENQADRVRHGTSNRGEQHPLAKLTNEDVVWIRDDYATGNFTLQDLALKFNVSKETVRGVVVHRRWRHL